MNQSESLGIECILPKAREKSRVQGAIGFWFSFSFAEKLARQFLANHQSIVNALARFISSYLKLLYRADYRTMKA